MIGELSLSSLGIGTYLGKDDDATDALYTAAVTRAVERGINVIDTAINYRHQRSERAIGAALRALIASGTVAREEILIASKAGFLPFDGGRPTNARQYFDENYVKRGVLRWEDVAGGCHCMAPKYLRDQLERSRANLGLETIDVYYLHNLEMQLDETLPAEFFKRVRLAFETLEAAVREDKIKYYGTATWNGYRVPASDPGHLSLDKLWALAREVGGDDHHFRVVQLPYNLSMPEAARAPTQGGHSFLEAAKSKVYVMTSASLMQGKLPNAREAVAAVQNTDGVGTALVGMKQTAHVDELTR